jgi:hypothetical protein
MDIVAIGPLITGGRQLQGAVAVLQFDHVLHASLAIAALADDDGPRMILSRCSRSA